MSNTTEGREAIIHLRVSAATKASWVRKSRAAGQRLTDWIVARVERAEGATKMDYIIDQNGRRGVVTERREGGVFARPDDVPYVIAAAMPGLARPAQAITATWWSAGPDGRLTGKWYDSKVGGKDLIAQTEP